MSKSKEDYLEQWREEAEELFPSIPDLPFDHDLNVNIDSLQSAYVLCREHQFKDSEQAAGEERIYEVRQDSENDECGIFLIKYNYRIAWFTEGASQKDMDAINDLLGVQSREQFAGEFAEWLHKHFIPIGNNNRWQSKEYVGNIK